jgi:hypothetical protein
MRKRFPIKEARRRASVLLFCCFGLLALPPLQVVMLIFLHGGWVTLFFTVVYGGFCVIGIPMLLRERKRMIAEALPED